MKKWTGIFIGIVIAAIVIYDIVAVFMSGKEATISSVLIAYFYEYPTASFLFGYVCGHLTWRMRSNKDLKKYDGEF